jgi:hypothetical protein
MIGTLLFLGLAIGSSYTYESAVAINITTVVTTDYRVRYDRVLFADGLTCAVNPQTPTFTFAAETDARQAWTALRPPFAAPRGWQNFRTMSSDCLALEASRVSEAAVFYILITAGNAFDIMLGILWVIMGKPRCRFRCWRSPAKETQAQHPTDPDAFSHISPLAAV